MKTHQIQSNMTTVLNTEESIQTVVSTKTTPVSNHCLSSEKHFFASSDYIFREVAGESILISTGNGIANFCGIVTLNDSARILWKALQNGTTQSDLVQLLQKEFSISEERALDDVTFTLEFLTEKGLIFCE